MKKPQVDVVLVALSTPILVGVYENSKLIEKIENEGRSSDVLPVIYKDLFKRYDIASLVYANGPGSFMSIKVAYVFLKSLSILKSIPLFAVDAFYFNANTPIKAIGKLHFVKIQGKIQTRKLQDVQPQRFELPLLLKKEDLSEDNAPMYGIGAV